MEVGVTFGERAVRVELRFPAHLLLLPRLTLAPIRVSPSPLRRLHLSPTSCLRCMRCCVDTASDPLNLEVSVRCKRPSLADHPSRYTPLSDRVPSSPTAHHGVAADSHRGDNSQHEASAEEER